MCFFLITFIIVTADAVCENGIVNLRRGENFSLCIRTAEPKMVRRLTVRRNRTQELFRYCSPEEQNHGCKPIHSERCSLQTDNQTVSVTILHANTSDGGTYNVEVIDNKHDRIHRNFTVTLTEQLPRSIYPEPPFIHPLTATSTKAVSSGQTWNIIWVIIVVIIAGIAVAIVVIVAVKRIRKKKHDAADDEGDGPGKSTALNFNTCGESAGELATGDSLKIVDETNFSVDNEESPEHGA